MGSLGSANRDIRINIARACSRLKKIYMTQHTDTNGFVHVTSANKYLKPWSFFLHSMGLGYTADHQGDKESEFSIQLGSKKLPERAQSSLTEQYSHFVQCCGKAPNINKIQYIEGCHILASDCRKVNAIGAGISTKPGELLNLRLKYPTAVSSDHLPKEVTCYLVAEPMLEISDSG